MPEPAKSPFTAAAIALNRFGLGARAGEPPPSDPKAWLKNQLSRYQPLPPALATFGDPKAQLAEAVEQLRELRDAAQGKAGNQKARREMQRTARDHFQDAANARAHAAIESDTPFAERLVHFWSNHFAISADKAAAIPFIPFYEATAIRPHVMGRFEDMLLAVERHPAMLLYLDQAQSAGPNSPLAKLAGRRNAKRMPGLNENLAREILELHTVGVRSGYTQNDVTEFARALTGWSIAGVGDRTQQRPLLRRRLGLRDDEKPAADGFQFREQIHEPGDRTILGRKYKQDGEGQARAVLHDLALSPATARHIATKLATHFAGDAPPLELVDRLAAVFERSKGDLPQLYWALIESPECWAPEPLKFKNPWEWTISALRGLGSADRLDKLQFGPLLQQLGQPMWRPGSPAGWDDGAGTWAAPNALMRRVELAQRFATAASRGEPLAVAQSMLPGSLGEPTRMAIASAESRATAIALLLVSPEFQRR
jgi:uncharacterized protein (DUF1800 family)